MRARKVLVIDGESGEGELLVETLEQVGCKVMTAATGRQGVRDAVVNCPDLVIVGRGLGEADGLATCDHLLSHELTASIPIVFVSAAREPAEQIRDWHSGVLHFVSKPATLDELIGCILYFVSQPRREADVLAQVVAA